MRVANEISSIIKDTTTTLDEKERELPTIDDLVTTFNDVSEKPISLRIDLEALTNATVHALHFADLINEIDIAYANAFDRKPMNMSGMQMDGEGNSSSISNLASYQTAKELINTAINLFNSTIKQNAPDNATERVNIIEGGLVQLKEIIEAKNQYDDVMGIIYGIIHTKTQEIFNLSLKEIESYKSDIPKIFMIKNIFFINKFLTKSCSKDKYIEPI